MVTQTANGIMRKVLADILACCRPGVAEPDERMRYKPALVNRDTHEVMFWLEDRYPLPKAFEVAKTMTVQLESEGGLSSAADSVMRDVITDLFKGNVVRADLTDEERSRMVSAQRWWNKNNGGSGGR